MKRRLPKVKLPLVVKVMPVYAVIIALFVVPYVVSQQKAAAVKSQAASLSRQLSAVSVQPVDVVAGKPSSILIPSVGIELSVVDGSVNNTTKTWSVADGVANYAVSTPTPSTKGGQTFIYGHWTQDVFGKLPSMQLGDTALVTTVDGHVFQYTYVASRVVDPTDVSILQNTKNERGLILMTCTGFRASERFVQYYNLESVK